VRGLSSLAPAPSVSPAGVTGVGGGEGGKEGDLGDGKRGEADDPSLGCRMMGGRSPPATGTSSSSSSSNLGFRVSTISGARPGDGVRLGVLKRTRTGEGDRDFCRPRVSES
jgi:hypothetical protein